MPANEKTPAPGQRGEGQGISVAGGSISKSTASNAGCPTLHVELCRNTVRLRGGRILQLLDSAGVTVRMYARATGTVTRAAGGQAFAPMLHELTAGCLVPASARFCAVAVLDEAIRRRCEELTARIGQAVESESLGSLLALVDAEHRAVRELADRRTAIAGAPPRLRAVSA